MKGIKFALKQIHSMLQKSLKFEYSALLSTTKTCLTVLLELLASVEQHVFFINILVLVLFLVSIPVFGNGVLGRQSSQNVHFDVLTCSKGVEPHTLS